MPAAVEQSSSSLLPQSLGMSTPSCLRLAGILQNQPGSFSTLHSVKVAHSLAKFLLIKALLILLRPQHMVSGCPREWTWKRFWSQPSHRHENRGTMPVEEEGHRKQISTLGPLPQRRVAGVSSLTAPTSAGGLECFHSSFQGKMTLHILSTGDFAPSITQATLIISWLLVYYTVTPQGQLTLHRNSLLCLQHHRPRPHLPHICVSVVLALWACDILNTR